MGWSGRLKEGITTLTDIPDSRKGGADRRIRNTDRSEDEAKKDGNIVEVVIKMSNELEGMEMMEDGMREDYIYVG